MKYVLPIVIILSFATFARSNEAVISGQSHSIMLMDSRVYMGGYPVDFIFTTYDNNRYTYPYYYDAQGASIYYSRELKKIGSLYYTDYFSLLYGSINDYGEISLNFGGIDSDNNGIDDICEKEKSINTNVTGNWYSYDNVSGSIGGSMIRNANTQHGYYNLTLNNTWAGNVPATGDFYIGVLSGSINYSVSSSSVTLNYTTTWDTQMPSDPLQTTYDIIDKDTIRFNGVDFFPTTSFERNGNKYTATVILSDGGDDTFWPDYRKWQVVIQDLNDSDGDGIPDLSDPPDPPKTKAMPWIPLLLLDE